ncbi:hypothetical protein [Vibrio nigripulchritudo]|uniref:hypothetical protein n=1 Tax=Vibrio nigripulchritudo TaxID=28173 RepID=UPI0024938243|nr:hypothetical protein [Vibrio nigripulchritudo]BDU36695.1 hypothetical protein TUMSATVNIG2_11640 [Vibrio nigripulchritudo]BDU42404.1 hypothetical protein TUMSATVNIG3_12020 [Vibrio nigripulchritudo]
MTIQSDYPLRVTRDKQAAEDYARALQNTMHEGNKLKDTFRTGWLMSSQDSKFIEEVQKSKHKPGKHNEP